MIFGGDSRAIQWREASLSNKPDTKSTALLHNGSIGLYRNEELLAC